MDVNNTVDAHGRLRYTIFMNSKTMLIMPVLAMIVSGFFGFSATAANQPAWQQPIPLSTTVNNSHDYRILSGSGGVAYYRLSVPAPTTHRVVLTIPRSSSPKFAAQIVLFVPSEETFGPLLPFEQPPQTLALVYGRTQPRVIFDAGTQILSTVTLETDIRFPVSGTYLLAVYNAGSEFGQYKLTMNPSSMAMSMSDAFVYPKTWIQDQMFAGFGWLTLITPVLVLLIGWLVYLRLDHHRLHPHKKYGASKPPTKPEVKQRRASVQIPALHATPKKLSGQRNVSVKKKKHPIKKKTI